MCLQQCVCPTEIRNQDAIPTKYSIPRILETGFATLRQKALQIDILPHCLLAKLILISQYLNYCITMYIYEVDKGISICFAQKGARFQFSEVITFMLTHTRRRTRFLPEDARSCRRVMLTMTGHFFPNGTIIILFAMSGDRCFPFG